MTLVIDASVAVKWVCAEPGSDEAIALQTERLIAPTLWLSEAGNALWRRVRIGDITADQARARLTELRQSPTASMPIEPLLDPALDLAIELNHPIYDCLYLALALRQDTDVITADRRFVSAIERRPELAGRVRLLGA